MLANRMTFASIRFLLIGAALLLPSCVELENPLSDPNKAKPDERLCGVWKVSDKDPDASEYWFMFVGKCSQPHAPSGIMRTIDVSNNKDNRMEVKECTYFFSTCLGKASYANLLDGKVLDRAKFAKWDKRNIKSYVLMKYAIENDTLTVWPLDTRAAEEAIKKGHVKGTVEEKGRLKLTMVKFKAEDLSRYLLNGGDKVLFRDENRLVFSRVK